MNLDNIKFGNPPKEQTDKVLTDRAGILKSCIDTGIIKDIIENHQFPKNSSDETRKELEYLVRITNKANADDYKFCKLMENNHYDFLQIAGKRLGIDVNIDEIKGWCFDMDPVLFYLKDKFNRPRPYQLADELGIELYPIITTDANSASYPSGHVLDFLVILYHFGKMNPNKASELNDLYHQIKRVRELSGVHYPSDRKVSEYLFTQLVKYELIK
jgi:hypothetical protein